MTMSSVYPVLESVRQSAHIDKTAYQRMYEQSVNDPDTFWADQAQQFLTWQKPWDSVCESDMHQGIARWFEGGQLNVSENC